MDRFVKSKCILTFMILLAYTRQVYGASCATENHCIEANFVSGTCTVDGSNVCTCDNADCVCADGFRLSGNTGGSCIRAGLTCVNDAVCNTANTNAGGENPYGTCDTAGAANICNCAAGYYPSEQVCTREGLACTVSGSECSDANTNDNAADPYGTCNPTTLRCNCAEGFTLSNGRCRSPGLPCNTDYQCTSGNTGGNTLYDTCNTASGVCNCATGFYASGRVCTRVGLDCANNDVCTAANTAAGTADPYGTCDTSTSRCNCATGYTAHMGACVLNAPTVQAPEGRTLDVVSGVDATVRCVPPQNVPVAAIASYAWEVNDVVVARATGSTHTVSSVSADTTVKCRLVTTNAANSSPFGTASTLRVLTTGVTFAGPPAVNNPTTLVVNDDGTFAPECINIPIGQVAIFKDASDNVLTSFRVPFVASGATPPTYKCVIENVAYTVTTEASSDTSYPTPGKFCTNNDGCAGMGAGYTGTCTSNRCVCSSGYTATLTFCRENTATGQPCASNGYCTESTSMTGTCQNNVCACKPNFYTSAQICRRVGFECSADTQCTTANSGNANADPYTTCDTTTSRCGCASGYWATGAACILTGMPCTTQNANTVCADNNKYTGVCTNDRCVCRDGVEKVDGDCNGSTPVAMSLVLMVMAVMMTRLF